MIAMSARAMTDSHFELVQIGDPLLGAGELDHGLAGA